LLQARPWFKSRPKDLSEEYTVEPKPLYSLLTESAKKNGGKTCLRYQGRSLTYSEIDEASSRFAAALLSLGLAKGDRVAIFSPNTPQFVISYYGILKAGGIVVPCSPLYKERELEFQLRDSGSGIVVAANDVVRGVDLYEAMEGSRSKLKIKHVIAASVTDYLPSFKKPFAGLAKVKNVKRHDTLSFVDLIRKNEPLEELAVPDPLSDVAVLQYTGGTTGTAKGAMLTHSNLYSNAAVSSTSLQIRPEDISLTVLPLFHIYGMTTAMNAPFFTGGTIVLLPRFHVEEVMKTIQNEKVTVFCGVPTMYIAINNHPEVAKFDLKTVRACLSGGAPLPLAVRKRFNEITGGNLVEGYGLSETSPVTHCNPLQGGVVKDGSVGIPLPGTDARVVALDDRSKVLATGEVGELSVKGPQVMKGYWNKEEETDLVLRDGWLLTGDIAKMDEDGYFYIVDRKKDMVDVGGLKVYPREVEEVLFEHPAVKEAAVIGIPDEYRGEAVKAFVVLKDPASSKSLEAEIMKFCGERMARYKVPRQVEFVPELPKTLVGKVLRRKLREASPSAQ
jgi:long-chain acyl-CoA synthetase